MSKRTWPTDELCDSCGSPEGGDTFVEVECDSQVAGHDFEPQEEDDTTCEVDGWLKIEHDLGRPTIVHTSCYLDHDDILVRV